MYAILTSNIARSDLDDNGELSTWHNLDILFHSRSTDDPMNDIVVTFPTREEASRYQDKHEISGQVVYIGGE